MRPFPEYLFKAYKSHIPDLLLILVALIWGIGFSVTNDALNSGISPSLLLALRMLIPGLVMGIFFFKDIKNTAKPAVSFGCKAGLLLFFGFLMQTIGMRFTSPANSAFITATNVVMVPFICWAFIGKRPSLRTFLLSGICFVGMSILSWTPAAGISFNRGDILTVLCALGFAGHISYLGLSRGHKISSGALAYFQLMTAGIFSLVVYFLFERDSFSTGALKNVIFEILYLGLLSTGVCFFLQSWAQRRLSPSRTAVLLSCEGLFGGLFSVIWGFDALTANFVLGGGVILISVVLVQIEPTKKKPAVSIPI